MLATKNLIKIAYNHAGTVSAEHVQLACEYLNKKCVIAVPTDTLYGIAARVQDSEALSRIYKIKGRDDRKPLAVCVANIEQIDQVADTSHLNKQLFRYLLPGPLTIVLKRSPNLNKCLNPDVDTIGVRIPDQPFINAITNIVGPIALTSANRSGDISPLVHTDFQDLWDELDCVFECGLLRGCNLEKSRTQRLGSTVVDLTQSRFYKIIREGCALDRTVSVLNRLGFRKAKGD